MSTRLATNSSWSRSSVAPSSIRRARSAVVAVITMMSATTRSRRSGWRQRGAGTRSRRGSHPGARWWPSRTAPATPRTGPGAARRCAGRSDPARASISQYGTTRHDTSSGTSARAPSSERSAPRRASIGAASASEELQQEPLPGAEVVAHRRGVALLGGLGDLPGGHTGDARAGRRAARPRRAAVPGGPLRVPAGWASQPPSGISALVGMTSTSSPSGSGWAKSGCLRTAVSR